MITLKLTQKQTDLIIHSLGSEAIRLNDDSFIVLRDNLIEQINIARKKRKGCRVDDTFTWNGHRFKGTMKEALEGIEMPGQPDLLTWCKDNLTEIK